MIDQKQLVIEELIAQYKCDPETPKDIIIIVKDQLEYIKKCLDSVFENTKNFNLYIWDNASKPETQDFLSKIPNTYLIRNEENLGFIIPNNRLVEKGNSPYVILLNSDTEVKKGWDTALIGYLQEKNIALVGYQGGLMNFEGLGINPHNGPEIDYVMGWCMAFPRFIYEKYGLFDEKNLQFAYGEDSDFSLRLKEANCEIYALNVFFVLHHANITTREVRKERSLKKEFLANHYYLKKRWKDYLENKRVLLKYPEVEKLIVEKAIEKYSITAEILADQNLS